MVEYISPAPAVISSPELVVEYIAPAPAVVQAPTPVVEYLAPVPTVFHAPVFPLSPDASDMSAPEDMYTSSRVSLPVPIKNCSTKVSAEAVGQACETPTLMHGRGLPAVSRDMEVGFALWLRKPLDMGTLGGSSGALNSFACYVLRACLLVRRPCGLREVNEMEEFWGPGGCEVCAGGPRDSNPGFGRAGGALGEEGAGRRDFRGCGGHDGDQGARNAEVGVGTRQET